MHKGHKVTGLIDHVYNAPPLGPPLPARWKKWGIVVAVKVDSDGLFLTLVATRLRRLLCKFTYSSVTTGCNVALGCYLQVLVWSCLAASSPVCPCRLLLFLHGGAAAVRVTACCAPGPLPISSSFCLRTWCASVHAVYCLLELLLHFHRVHLDHCLVPGGHASPPEVIGHIHAAIPL